ncbi:hypothetical protein CDD83_10460 [Cordyceps sp. RAO-2017]|nr:hypothetical protein CDD83_10460 [Cordyceps sp. RAO-2017]
MPACSLPRSLLAPCLVLVSGTDLSHREHSSPPDHSPRPATERRGSDRPSGQKEDGWTSPRSSIVGSAERQTTNDGRRTHGCFLDDGVPGRGRSPLGIRPGRPQPWPEPDTADEGDRLQGDETCVPERCDRGGRRNDRPLTGQGWPIPDACTLMMPPTAADDPPASGPGGTLVSRWEEE